MLEGLPALNEQHLVRWIDSAIAENQHVLGSGYQGKVLLYQDSRYKLVIKVPTTSIFLHWLYIRMLKHEHAVYQKLAQCAGVPKCHGMLENRYLVLEYIDGKSLRQQRPQQESIFFTELFELLQRLHQTGVAHLDLKKKDNILCVEGKTPYLIDFGVAIVKKPGWRVFNQYLFMIGRRFDYNAWIKHKYQKHYKQISLEDMPYYNRSIIEIVSSKFKSLYKFLLK